MKALADMAIDSNAYYIFLIFVSYNIFYGLKDDLVSFLNLKRYKAIFFIVHPAQTSP